MVINKKVQNDIYTIIMKFTYNNSLVLNSIPNRLEDFIHNAYVFYTTTCYHNYDSTKAKLSTHIYSCLSYCLYTLIKQTELDITFTKAKYLSDGRMKEEEKQFYYPTSIDTTSAQLDLNTGIEGENTKKDDINLAQDDDDCLVDKQLISQDVYKEFNIILNQYFNVKCKNKPLTKERNKAIIINHIFLGVTYTKLSEKYSISRQRVEQIVSAFRRFAKNSKKLKELLVS